MLRAQTIQLTRQAGPLFGLVGAVVLLIAISAVAALGMANSVSSGSLEITDRQIREIPSLGFAFAQLFLGSAFILLVTTEWSSGSIITSVATTQRKSGILWSKALVSIIFAAVSMAAGAVLACVASNVALSSADRSIDLGDWLVQRELIGLVVAGVFSSLLALGLAFLVRQTALTLVIYIAVTIVAPIAFGMFPTTFMQTVSSYLPLNVSGYMMVTGEVPDTGLTLPEAYFTLAAWAVVSLLLGWWRMARTARTD